MADDRQESVGAFMSGEDPVFTEERGPAPPSDLREEIRKVLQRYDADEIDELGVASLVRDLVG